MPTLLTRAFADAGDKTLPPDNDNSGFVSFLQGYTSDYERNLASGDTLAKAVERPIQNALFNLITDHLLWYQSHGFMQWFSNKSGGYNFNDLVIDTTVSTEPRNWRVFRCRKNGVTSRPTSVAATASNPDWDEVFLPSVQRTLIPFQSGPDYVNTKNSTAAFITGGAISALTKGFYIAPNATVVAAVTDKPSKISDATPLKPFTVEVAVWDTTENSTATTYRIERLVTVDNFIFTRTSVNGAIGNWTQQATPNMVARGWLNLATAATAGNGLTLTPNVPFTANAGAHLHFQSTVSSNGTDDFTLTIGGTSYALIGRDGLKLCKNAIQANTWVEVVFINATTALLLSATSGQFQVPTATEDNAAPTWKQVKDLFASALDFDKIFPIGFTVAFMNGTDPNVAYPGTTWEKMAEGTMWRNKEDADGFGAIKGADSTNLVMAQIPSHNHTVNITTGQAGSAIINSDATDLGSKTTSPNGAHNHSFSGSTNTAGLHSHNASIGNGGAHNHTAPVERSPNAPTGPQVTGGIQWGGGITQITTNAGTSTDGTHSHAISIEGNGNHSHSFSGNTNSVDNHTHSIALGSHLHVVRLPDHAHTVSGNTGNAGSANPTAVPTLSRSIGVVGWTRTA